MNDSEIVQLYWERNQTAISATSEKYGHYCNSIARNILGNNEDAEECVNDTYLNAWNSMPPHRPDFLSTFIGKITRNLSFNRYKRQRAEKRGGGEFPLVLDELGSISGFHDVEQEIDRQELVEAINVFLNQLPIIKRNIFICRYWYADSISDIAKRFEMTDNNVSVTLTRTRNKLKAYLSERGFEL